MEIQNTEGLAHIDSAFSTTIWAVLASYQNILIVPQKSIMDVYNTYDV